MPDREDCHERSPSEPEIYPPYVRSATEKRRWNLAAAIAKGLFADLGDPASLWMATRVIYRSDIPTDS
jgi:hypothetical protein